MSDKIMEAGFDHPCRQTCSGWQQGYERGKFEVSKERDSLKAEVERLTNILGQDRLDDWKRIQDAEREVERLKLIIEVSESATGLMHQASRIHDLQARLEKAVEALETIANASSTVAWADSENGFINTQTLVARSALKLIKGDGE